MRRKEVNYWCARFVQRKEEKFSRQGVCFSHFVLKIKIDVVLIYINMHKCSHAPPSSEVEFFLLVN